MAASADRPTASRSEPVTAAVLIVLAALAAAYLAFPGLREPLTREDGVTEWLTAAGSLASGIAALVVLRRHRPQPRWSWLLPLAGFVGFGEETAYGARILGFPLPQYDGRPIDSLHDVFDLGEGILADLGIGRASAAAGALLVLAIGALLARARLRRLPGWLRSHPAVGFVLGWAFLSLIAVGLDLVGTSIGARFAEELLELAAVGVLLIGATRLRPEPAEQHGELPLEEAA